MHKSKLPLHPLSNFMHLLLSFAFEVCVISLRVSGPATQALAHFEALCIRRSFDYAIQDNNNHTSAADAQVQTSTSSAIKFYASASLLWSMCHISASKWTCNASLGSFWSSMFLSIIRLRNTRQYACVGSGCTKVKLQKQKHFGYCYCYCYCYCQNLNMNAFRCTQMHLCSKCISNLSFGQNLMHSGSKCIWVITYALKPCLNVQMHTTVLWELLFPLVGCSLKNGSGIDRVRICFLMCANCHSFNFTLNDKSLFCFFLTCLTNKLWMTFLQSLSNGVVLLSASHLLNVVSLIKEPSVSSAWFFSTLNFDISRTVIFIVSCYPESMFHLMIPPTKNTSDWTGRPLSCHVCLLIFPFEDIVSHHEFHFIFNCFKRKAG